MTVFSRSNKRKRTWAQVTLLVGVPVLLFCLPSGIDAGTADSSADSPEVFASPPGQETSAARSALSSHFLAVHGPTGVRQRLLSPSTSKGPESSLPDFQDIKDIQAKKKEFFSFLKPMVEQENQRLLQIRKRLGFIRDHFRFQRPLNSEDQQWLIKIVKEFRFDHLHPQDPESWSDLLLRVDVLPVDLVLVQAANESAWGTSRFAREGNNLFGQWCFRPGCGIVPAGRPEGSTYEVAAFDTIKASISSYMRNLNTGRVYHDLRLIRERCKTEGVVALADELAKGLTSYSERGLDYVTEIRTMLRQNATVIAQLGLR